MCQTPAHISGSMSGHAGATAALADRVLDRPAARLALVFGFALLTRWRGRGIVGPVLIFLLGAVTIHACGLAWLCVVLADASAALRAGLLPFILFDLAKVVVATGTYAGYLRWKPSTLP